MNVLDGNGGGIELVSGTVNSVVAGNSVTDNGGAGILLRDATGNRLEANGVVGGGDLGIGLERATGNTLIGNMSTGNSDGGIEVMAGSHANRVEGNLVTESGDTGILVSESDRNLVIGNVTHLMSDSGITLDTANDGVVRGNDTRFNTGGLQLDGSSRNVIEDNDASQTSGIGIELGGGSLENLVQDNTANANGAQGIHVADDTTDELGNPALELANTIRANTANDNEADGIVVAKGSHFVAGNVALGNGGWGISAADGAIDGGGNVAFGNAEPAQCLGVVCLDEIPPVVDVTPPQTTILSGPMGLTRSTSAAFTFSASEPGSTFQCALDAFPFAACTSPRQLSGLGQGAHQLRVRAIDPAGNVDPSPASRSWTIDTLAPNTTIVSGPVGTVLSPFATFAFGASEAGSTFECALDRGAFAACTSPVRFAGLRAGTHTFRVRATDVAGNTDATPATRTWTVGRDTTPPNTIITGGPHRGRGAGRRDLHLHGQRAGLDLPLLPRRRGLHRLHLADAVHRPLTRTPRVPRAGH